VRIGHVQTALLKRGLDMAGAAQELDLQMLAQWATGAAASATSRDFTKPLTISKILVANATKQNFADAKSPSGESWAPLKKPRKGGKQHPLWDTGRLVASTGSGAGHVEELTRDTLVFGTNVEYAAIHNYGGTINMAARQGEATTHKGLFANKAKALTPGRMMKSRTYHFMVPAHTVTIPQRQFLGIGEKLAEEIAATFAKFEGEQLE
jgi:phage gpG-like protein